MTELMVLVAWGAFAFVLSTLGDYRFYLLAQSLVSMVFLMYWGVLCALGRPQGKSIWVVGFVAFVAVYGVADWFRLIPEPARLLGPMTIRW